MPRTNRKYIFLAEGIAMHLLDLNENTSFVSTVIVVQLQRSFRLNSKNGVPIHTWHWHPSTDFAMTLPQLNPQVVVL